MNKKLFIMKKDIICKYLNFAHSGCFVNEKRSNVQISLFCPFLSIFARAHFGCFVNFWGSTARMGTIRAAPPISQWPKHMKQQIDFQTLLRPYNFYLQCALRLVPNVFSLYDRWNGPTYCFKKLLFEIAARPTFLFFEVPDPLAPAWRHSRKCAPRIWAAK